MYRLCATFTGRGTRNRSASSRGRPGGCDGSGPLLRAGVGRGSARGAAAERFERCSAEELRSVWDGAPTAPQTPLFFFF